MNEYERKYQNLVEQLNSFEGDEQGSDYVRLRLETNRAEAEAYLESIIPGQWDEENVKMLLAQWRRENSIMGYLEGDNP